MNPRHIQFVQFVDTNWTATRYQSAVSFQRLGMTIVAAKPSRHCYEANLIAGAQVPPIFGFQHSTNLYAVCRA